MRSSFGQARRRSRMFHLLGILLLALIGSWLGYHGYLPIFSKTAEPVSTSMVDVNLEPQPEYPLLAGSRKKSAPATHEAIIIEKVDSLAAKAAKTLNDANRLAEENNLIAARQILTDYLNKHFEQNSSQPLRDRAVELGKTTILSMKVYPDDPLCFTYRVDVGDTLLRLAYKSKIPYQFLCKINQISDPRRLREGQRIKLVKGPIQLKVIKHELMMYVFLQDTLFAKYQVGLGKNNKTPVGKWIVEDRVLRPQYEDPDTHEIYGPNDKDNPTGGYWVRLRGVEGETVGRTGFGIHGTNEPESIGKFMSKGCVRMRNEDIAEVFDMLTTEANAVYTLP